VAEAVNSLIGCFAFILISSLVLKPGCQLWVHPVQPAIR